MEGSYNPEAVHRPPPTQGLRGPRGYKLFKNPPQPHMCIQDSIKGTSEKLYINVMSWKQIGNTRPCADLIPLYGGMQIPHGCTPNCNRPPLIVFAVMVNPEILKVNGKNAPNPQERDALVSLLCDFVEAMNPGLQLTKQPIILKDRDLAGELKDVWHAVQAHREKEKIRNQEANSEITHKIYHIDGPPERDPNAPPANNSQIINEDQKSSLPSAINEQENNSKNQNPVILPNSINSNNQNVAESVKIIKNNITAEQNQMGPTKNRANTSNSQNINISLTPQNDSIQNQLPKSNALQEHNRQNIKEHNSLAENNTNQNSPIPLDCTSPKYDKLKPQVNNSKQPQSKPDPKKKSNAKQKNISENSDLPKLPNESASENTSTKEKSNDNIDEKIILKNCNSKIATKQFENKLSEQTTLSNQSSSIALPDNKSHVIMDQNKDIPFVDEYRDSESNEIINNSAKHVEENFQKLTINSPTTQTVKNVNTQVATFNDRRKVPLSSQ